MKTELEIARREFERYWLLCTGCEWGDGAGRTARFAIDPELDAAHDEYRITSRTDGIDFTGSTGRSVIYAVYDFLARRAGCRWFWDGDVVPRRSDIDITGLDVREKSRFEYRAIRYFAHRGLTRFQAEHWGRKEWVREIDWCLKRRLNCIMPRIGMDDTWQKAFPDIVGYPAPDDKQDAGLSGYDNRTPFWDLRHRGELRKFIREYAFERGLMIPTDFGTMTHWYSRTPPEFLEAKNPSFLPQANSNYGERTGLVWDIFQGEWADDYMRLTEAFIDAGYGSADLLHTIGLGERMCFSDRAKNLEVKRKALFLMIGKALAKYPGAKILLAGWDFYSTWRPDEIRDLLKDLDPEKILIWDYEGEASPEVDGDWMPDNSNNFTRWGLVGKFPYTFGVFLAYENALDIRAHYGVIEERERIAAADPFCKGYLLWPESSHTDTFLLRYFTANAWNPGQSHLDLLPEFCRDRYGEAAPVFEALWRDVLPVSQLLGWWDNWGRELMSWLGEYCQGHGLEADGRTLSVVPRIYASLAAIAPEGEFQIRDAIDIARTAGDRLAIWAHQKLLKAFFTWCDGGAGDGDEVASWCRRYLDLVCTQADILALHTDYSLSESLERLKEEAPIFSPDFETALIDNASCQYCRSHQYEVTMALFLPFARDLVDEIMRRVAAGERTRIPDEWARERSKALVATFRKTGLAPYRPAILRTLDSYRNVMRAAYAAATTVLGR